MFPSRTGSITTSLDSAFQYLNLFLCVDLYLETPDSYNLEPHAIAYQNKIKKILNLMLSKLINKWLEGFYKKRLNGIKTSTSNVKNRRTEFFYQHQRKCSRACRTVIKYWVELPKCHWEILFGSYWQDRLLTY